MTEPRRVLLVDDEDAVRDVLARALRTEGHEVRTAKRPDQALELLAETKGGFHLAIVDVRLPDMDGAQLVRILRRLQPGLLVLFITGDGSEVPKDTLQEHMLWKPFPLDRFLPCVRELLATGCCESCAPVKIARKQG
jgi:DNA-binding response OmpR family regulator